jgi:signal transduction histidine kinase
VLVNDYRTSPHALPLVLDGSQITAVLAEPLIYRDRLLGVIGVDNEDIGRPFTEEDRNLLALFATHIAIAIANAQLFGEVRAGRERLQNLSRRLVEVQEAERRHIARELHDEIGQALTGLKLVLSMQTPLPTDVARQSHADAQAMIGDLLARVRELSLDLRPAMLDDLGLVPTLAWHFERYTARTNVQVVFKHAGLEGRRFPPDAETAAYRIVQEALTNVARHAVGQEATVRLWASQDCLSVQIEDRGKGFEPEAVFAAYTSGGLSGMRERAELLGGRMTVESTPGVGTLVTAELPLGQPGRGKEKVG